MKDTRKRIETPIADGKITVMERQYDWRDNRGYHSKPRMYVHASNEFDCVEDLMNRRRRPFKVWRKAIRENLAGFGIDLEAMPWSQTAGCGCGCSPAFVLNHQTIEIAGEVFRHFDVWVTLEGAPSVDETKEARFALV
jgi:hypothetical protein